MCALVGSEAALDTIVAEVLAHQPVLDAHSIATPMGVQAEPYNEDVKENAVERDPQGELYFYDACNLLGISSKTLKLILRDFADLIGVQPGMTLDANCLPRLEQIVSLKRKGKSVLEIRRCLIEELSFTPGSTDTPKRDAPSDGDMTVLMRQVIEQLRLLEFKRDRDRDILLTALSRAYREIELLRYQVCTQRSRRDRKRRSALARLLGV